MPYLMESLRESERLLKKSDEASSRDQLCFTGLSEGMVAVDAGGGAGFVSKIMSEIVGKKGEVILLDQSQDRVRVATTQLKNFSNFRTIVTPLEKINLASNCADYTFCRFVFEYLENTQSVFDELVRITRPGGKLVVGDLDYNCLSHYPLSPHLESQMKQIMGELQRKKLLDPYAGRKIYSHYQEAGFKNVKVHLIAHHMIYGEPQKRDLENWTQKLEQLEHLTEKS